jgi:long-chain acyl-CoA synthetase
MGETSRASPRASSVTGDPDPSLDTFPKLAMRNAQARADRVAIREKDYGIWLSYTWRQYAEQARLIALGLASLGFARGDRTAIVGDNRPQLYWAMLATQALGGVPVPLYQDSIETEMQYIVDHAEARFAVVEDQEQVDKLLSVRAQCPRLEAIVYDDPRGLRRYTDPALTSLADLQERGRRFDAEHPGYFDREVAKGQGDDLAIICYTSGTTGQPKGAMLSHRNLIATARSAIAHEGLRETEEVLAYLPMAWVGDHMFSFGQSIVAGFTTNCPESARTVLQDLREIGPTYFFAPPRIWENILTAVMIRVDDASAIKRRMVHFFLEVARRVERCRLARRPVGPRDRLLRALGRVLVYGPLRDNLGMGRIRIAYTAGEAIGPELFEFYRALGVNVKQLYGMTESSALICIQRDGDVKLDTVGTPLPGVEVRISDTGEVLYRSPGVFQGYYKNPEATAEMVEDGWVHSGDAGVFDRDGHLRIIDRARDVGRLADSTLFAPKYLENKLKFSPFIKEAVCVGSGRPFVAALINIDLVAAGSWAERRNIAYTSYADLAQKPEVYELIRQEVARVNRSLLEDEALRGAQIRKFLLLHKELDPDDQEITRTRKVRRGIITEKYAGLIEALYSDSDHVKVEARVTYEDGRTGTVRADVKIRHAEVFAAAGAAP